MMETWNKDEICAGCCEPNGPLPRGEGGQRPRRSGDKAPGAPEMLPAEERDAFVPRGFRVKTCRGGRGCPNQVQELGSLLDEVGASFERRCLEGFPGSRVEFPLRAHHAFRLSIARCPNACSRPQIADFGLIGALEPCLTDIPCSHCGACLEACREQALRMGVEGPEILLGTCLACGACVRSCPSGRLTAGRGGFRVLLGGKLGRHPRLASELKGIWLAEEVPGILDACLDVYQTVCRAGERLGSVMEREGEESLVKKIVEKGRVLT